MIRIGPRPETPGSLLREKVSDKEEELASRVNGGEKLKAEDFQAYWLNEDVRRPLWDIHHGKCAYCERRREIKRESDVEHYRPKTEVSDDPGHAGYWWLAYEWSNYLFSCKPCNQTFKRNQFPLLTGSARAYGPSENTSIEKPILLNPIDDNPESCISFDWWSSSGLMVIATGIDEEARGTETIKIVGLNRNGLPEDRGEIVQLLALLARSMHRALDENNASRIKKYSKEIKRQTSSARVFAAFRRAFFRAMDLGEFIEAD